MPLKEDSFDNNPKSRENLQNTVPYFRSLSNIRAALLLITFGIILLLNNLGILPWVIWLNLWRFWPVLLILLGIRIIFGRSLIANIFLTVISLFIIATILVFAVLSVKPDWNQNIKNYLPWWNIETVFNVKEKSYDYKITDENYKYVYERNINIKLGGVTFNLSDNNSNDITTVNGTYYNESQKLNVSQEGINNSATITFSEPGFNNSFFNNYKVSNYQFQIGKPDLKTNFDINIGAGKGTVNLNSLNINNLDINNGAGEFQLSFTDKSAPKGKLNVKTGAGSIKIRVPKSLGLVIDYSIGVGSLKVDNKSLLGKGEFRSDNYQSANNKLQIEAGIGAGSIEVIYE